METLDYFKKRGEEGGEGGRKEDQGELVRHPIFVFRLLLRKLHDTTLATHNNNNRRRCDTNNNKNGNAKAGRDYC